MKAIYVHDTRCIPYTHAIVAGYKRIESRTKNVFKAMLNNAECERVAVIRTVNGSRPFVVGYVTIHEGTFCDAETFKSDRIRNLTLVPEGSRYDTNESGKWCYPLTDGEMCSPYLPTVVRSHGRSWCEIA